MKRFLVAALLALALVGCGQVVGPDQAPSEHTNGQHG